MRIEIVHSRDSDAGCETRLFIDGVEHGFEQVTIDPGYGHDFCDYADTFAGKIASSSPAVAEIVYEDALYALDSEYVEGTPDDERVTQRYLDLLIRNYKEGAIK